MLLSREKTGMGRAGCITDVTKRNLQLGDKQVLES